jgi:hypothetical protein
MASLSVIKDATVPLDTSNWTPVTNKKSNSNNKAREKLEAMKMAMKKTKLSIIIRIPNDALDSFSVAEAHFATIREICKQDSNLITLDSKGINQVNIHKTFGPDKYKEAFQPREKTFSHGTVQVSIAHYVLSEVESFNKALLIPFLKKNKIFIYFNQKDGLEHFSAIGALFGPHPTLTWRQDIIERIEKTMKADITAEECEAINTDIKDPKIVISMVPTQISNPKFNKTTSIALEIRVPAAHEKIYINILDRLNERASTLEKGEVDITLDDRIGVFFPYYAKKSRPELYDSLMKKQNTDMNMVSAIPLFGLSPEALEFEMVDKNGEKKSIREWIFAHDNILHMLTTASSKDLGKYMLMVDREFKDDAEEYIDNLFDHMPECENHSVPFKKPQRGGNAHNRQSSRNIKNYLDKLEQRVKDDLSMYEEDDLSTSPPARPRRLTISYAQAAKRLSFQSGSENSTGNQTNSGQTTNTNMSTLTQSTLNEAIEKIRNETAQSIEKLRADMQKDIQSMEGNIAAAVINALKATPTTVQMDTDTEVESTQSTQDTTTTMKTIADKFEALTNIVQTLSQQVLSLTTNQEKLQKELAEKGEANLNKRNRPPDLPARKLAPSLNSAHQQAQSPPTKQPRASTPTPPATPPPKGIPATAGTREGS